MEWKPSHSNGLAVFHNRCLKAMLGITYNLTNSATCINTAVNWLELGHDISLQATMAWPWSCTYTSGFCLVGSRNRGTKVQWRQIEWGRIWVKRRRYHMAQEGNDWRAEYIEGFDRIAQARATTNRSVASTTTATSCEPKHVHQRL